MKILFSNDEILVTVKKMFLTIDTLNVVVQGLDSWLKLIKRL